MRKILLALSAALPFGLAGCFFLELPPPEDLELHGEAGKAVSIFPGMLAAVPVYLVCAPVTVPLDYANRADDVMNWRTYSPEPPRFVQKGFYYFGAAMAYPVYCCFPKEDWSFMPDSVLRDRLLAQMPYLDENEYALLVKSWGRAYAPQYAPFAPDYRHGVFDPAFGARDRLAPRVQWEWKEWEACGKPEGGRFERKFAIRFWIYKAVVPNGEGLAIAERAIRDANPEVRASEFDGFKSLAHWRSWIDEHGGLPAVADGNAFAEAEELP